MKKQERGWFCLEGGRETRAHTTRLCVAMATHRRQWPKGRTQEHPFALLAEGGGKEVPIQGGGHAINTSL